MFDLAHRVPNYEHHLRQQDSGSGIRAVHTLLELSRPAAAKTGTTDDNRDGWTIGYTPQLVTGVWVGNSDGSPTQNLTGMRGATPIWNAFMEAALADEQVLEFERPRDMVEVEVCRHAPACCRRPTAAKPMKRYFLRENSPKVVDNIFRAVPGAQAVRLARRSRTCRHRNRR